MEGYGGDLCPAVGQNRLGKMGYQNENRMVAPFHNIERSIIKSTKKRTHNVNSKSDIVLEDARYINLIKIYKYIHFNVDE